MVRIAVSRLLLVYHTTWSTARLDASQAKGEAKGPRGSEAEVEFRFTPAPHRVASATLGSPIHPSCHPNCIHTTNRPYYQYQPDQGTAHYLS